MTQGEIATAQWKQQARDKAMANFLRNNPSGRAIPREKDSKK